MAYRVEGKDLVISGFEQGIADTPYSGISDMRNMELITVPGEASVEPVLTAVTQPPAVSAVAYTAAASTDRLTVSSTTGYYSGMAIVLASNTATGLSNNVIYYVQSIVGNTFQVSLAPANTTPVNITVDGTGTLSAIQYDGENAPISYYIERQGELAGANSTIVIDGQNYAWAILTAAQQDIPANTLIYLGNYGVTQFQIASGVAVWNGYLMVFTFQGIDYADMNGLWVTGVAAAWDYSWEVISPRITNLRIGVLSSKEDGNLYYTSTDGLGSLIETPGDSFDPTDTTTYTITDSALLLPESDESTCMAELGSYLLVGGRLNFIYVWNKVDPGFSSLLNIPENFTSNIVATSQNAYVFSGTRGRIYITNGSGIDIYKKFPDYLTGVQNPFIRWQDANFGRNQLYFSLTATDMSGTTINTLAGIWAIDIDTDALRMINKTNNTAYQGTVRMVAERPPSNSGNPVSSIRGNGLQVGWYENTTGSIDLATVGTGYQSYESYLETDMIPVGTYLDPFTPSQIEWKTSAPLVNGEGIKLYYRQNISDAWTLVGTSAVSAGNMVGSTTGTSSSTQKISDYYTVNFEKVQWSQFKVETATTSTNPSYVRLTEIRIRDYPSGKDAKG